MRSLGRGLEAHATAGDSLVPARLDRRNERVVLDHAMFDDEVDQRLIEVVQVTPAFCDGSANLEPHPARAHNRALG
jgi:hypothetical protein